MVIPRDFATKLCDSPVKFGGKGELINLVINNFRLSSRVSSYCGPPLFTKDTLFC